MDRKMQEMKFFFDQDVKTLDQAFDIFKTCFEQMNVVVDEYRTMKVDKENLRFKNKFARQAIYEHRENIKSGMSVDAANVILWRLIGLED